MLHLTFLSLLFCFCLQASSLFMFLYFIFYYYVNFPVLAAAPDKFSVYRTIILYNSSIKYLRALLNVHIRSSSIFHDRPYYHYNFTFHLINFLCSFYKHPQPLYYIITLFYFYLKYPVLAAAPDIISSFPVYFIVFFIEGSFVL